MKIRTAIAATFLLVTASYTAEAAVDPQKFLEALTARLDGFGIALKATAEAQGENIVLKGLNVGLKAEAGKSKDVGEVTLENVTESGGNYTIGQITIPGTQTNDGKVILDFGGAKVKNVAISAPDEKDPVRMWSMYESVEIGSITLTDATSNLKALSIDGATISLSPYAAGQPMVTSMSVPNIVWDLASVKEPQAQAFFNAAGYKQFVASLNVNGTWNPADGRFVISEESLNVKDVGKLNFTFDLGGYTAQFIESVQKLTKDSAGQSDAASGAQMMGLLQGLTLNGMSIRFDDASITGKTLDFVAKMSGQPKEALVAQVKGMTPLMVMQLGDAELSTSVSNAVSAFMDNPKSLEIKTGAPVPFSQIVAAATTNPMSIVQMFKLQVTANQ
jgi:hypothetical protein